MSSDEEGLVESEYPLAIKIFRVLRWTMVLCSLLCLVVAVVLLFKGFRWYYVLVGYLVGNVFFRVLKTYFRNIVEDLESEQDALGEQTF